MGLAELGTAVQSGARPVIVLLNNGSYGTIRMHQETHYPKRKSGTDLYNPDFAALARSYGAIGETVTTTSDFADVFERCCAASRPSLIELVIEPDAVLPTNTLSAIQKNALGG